MFVGGHSASFIVRELLDHSDGAIDCVLKGEGEAAVGAAARSSIAARDPRTLLEVPGVVTALGSGPPPLSSRAWTDLMPRAISCGIAASISSACSTHVPPSSSAGVARGIVRFAAPGHSTDAAIGSRARRRPSPSSKQIREPGVFIVDDVAFIQAQHGMAIGEAIARAGIKKQYYLETRGDVLLRNKEVFRFWKTLGLQYMFLGVEAIDEEGLTRYRKRVSVSKNFEALEFARSLGVMVAINIIADPDWDRRQFEVIRQWCLDIPEIVNISVNTPYPGTESWLTESRRLTTRDYRLFDIQHAVLPTRFPSRTSMESWSEPSRCSTASTWDGRRSSRWRGSWPATCRGARPTRSRCSGSSTAFTTRSSKWPTTLSPSSTS